MKLVFACSPSHDPLKRYVFLSTLCEKWDLVELRFFHGGSGNYNSADYNKVIVERVNLMREIAEESPNEIVVFSDVDIQWFRPAQQAILQALEGLDLVFQREMPEQTIANCGFLALRSNRRALDYLTELCGAATNGQRDQEATNALITRGLMPCSFGFLPYTFCNDNFHSKWRPSPTEMILYHSIGTIPTPEKTSIQIKLERHLAARALVLGSPAVLRFAHEFDPACLSQQPIRYTGRNAKDY